MKQLLRVLAAALFLAAGIRDAAAGDALSEYQKVYSDVIQISNREDVLKALAATGKPEAMRALQWCVAFSKGKIEEGAKEVEKLRPRLLLAQEKADAVVKAYFDKLRAAGEAEPDVRRIPHFPEEDELLDAQAAMATVENPLIRERMMLAAALDAHGALVAKMSADAQKKVREDWKKTLSGKDWGLRADCFQMLGRTPADWALEMLVAAADPAGAQPEPDARALVAAIDGLSGKDAAKVTRALVARLDDVRWLVRVAVVRALEMTPSKEGIDALIKRFPQEDGRIKADCGRALSALTGQKMPANPEMWRLWWEKNREQWKGKPAVEEELAYDPSKDLDKPVVDEDARKTGFFGIEVESKRVVFVIDVSGSMVDPMGGGGPDAKLTRAAVAKSELKRVLAALEDGAIFNIVFFSTAAHAWKPEMQVAGPQTRKEALEHVDAIPVVGATNTYQALEQAFNLGDVGKGKKRESDPTGDARVDTIMFLSDGAPTKGVTDKEQIRAAVRAWNRSRRVMIHSIAFGTAVKGGADPKFMKALADESGGKYVEK